MFITDKAVTFTCPKYQVEDRVPVIATVAPRTDKEPEEDSMVPCINIAPVENKLHIGRTHKS